MVIVEHGASRLQAPDRTLIQPRYRPMRRRGYLQWRSPPCATVQPVTVGAGPVSGRLPNTTVPIHGLG